MMGKCNANASSPADAMHCVKERGARAKRGHAPTAQQIVNPEFATEPSLCQVNDDPADTATLLGPVVPWNCWPLMVT